MTRTRRRSQPVAHPAPSTSPTARAPWQITATVLLLLAAAVITYSNSLPAPFVFDDVNTVEGNPHITRLWPILEAARAPVQSAVSGRPIVSLSLALSYAQGGLSPATFRLGNIAILTLAAMVLFGIIRRTLASRGDHGTSGWLTATAIALLWLVHPLQTEVVGYITQRTESLMGLFYLLTLYCAIRCMEGGQRADVWAAAAVLACTAGMGSKEVMVTAPVLVLLYDVVFAAGSVSGAIRKRPLLYGGLAASWLVLAILNLGGPRSRSAGFSTAVTPWTYLLNQAVMIVTYLKLAVWSHPLVLDYGRTRPIALATALPYGAVVVSLMGLVMAAWIRGRREIAYLGIWFFLTLAPSSSVVPIATEVGAERRMHLALAAVITAVVVGVRAVTRRWPAGSWIRRPTVGAAAIAVTAITLGSVTTARNREYLDPIALWQGVIATRDHGRAHYNLAIALQNAGRMEEAMAHYQTATADEPVAHYALGFELGRSGQYRDAERELAEYITLQPDGELVPDASLLRGQALVNLGRTLDAERAFRDTLRMEPAHPDARLALADVLMSQGRPAEALPLYRDLVTLAPDRVESLRGLGLALYASGQGAEALQVFEKIVAMQPNDPDALTNLGHALAAEGRLPDAIARYRAALALAPTRASLMSTLALVLAANGEREEAITRVTEARRLAPDDPNVQSDYQSIVTQTSRPR